MFRLDRAAFVASDQLVGAARGRVDPRVQGWITDERDGAIEVTFVDATPAALYRVRIDAQGQPAGAVDANPPPLSPAQVAAAQARAVALAAAPDACSGFYNPVVVPGPDEAWEVYLLPGPAEPEVLPLGGAWRIEVRDGQPGARRAYSNSCLALDNTDVEGDTRGFVVTHLLDPAPTEVHVFWSLWAGKPMYVSAGGKAWAIAQGTIRQVPDDGAGAPATMAPTP